MFQSVWDNIDSIVINHANPDHISTTSSLSWTQRGNDDDDDDVDEDDNPAMLMNNNKDKQQQQQQQQQAGKQINQPDIQNQLNVNTTNDDVVDKSNDKDDLVVTPTTNNTSSQHNKGNSNNDDTNDKTPNKSKSIKSKGSNNDNSNDKMNNGSSKSSKNKKNKSKNNKGNNPNCHDNDWNLMQQEQYWGLNGGSGCDNKNEHGVANTDSGNLQFSDDKKDKIMAEDSKVHQLQTGVSSKSLSKPLSHDEEMPYDEVSKSNMMKNDVVTIDMARNNIEDNNKNDKVVDQASVKTVGLDKELSSSSTAKPSHDDDDDVEKQQQQQQRQQQPPEETHRMMVQPSLPSVDSHDYYHNVRMKRMILLSLCLFCVFPFLAIAFTLGFVIGHNNDASANTPTATNVTPNHPTIYDNSTTNIPNNETGTIPPSNYLSWNTNNTNNTNGTMVPSNPNYCQDTMGLRFMVNNGILFGNVSITDGGYKDCIWLQNQTSIMQSILCSLRYTPINTICRYTCYNYDNIQSVLASNNNTDHQRCILPP